MYSPFMFVAWLFLFCCGWLLGVATYISWIFAPFRVVILIGGFWLIINHAQFLVQGLHPITFFYAGLIWGATSAYRKLEE